MLITLITSLSLSLSLFSCIICKKITKNHTIYFPPLWLLAIGQARKKMSIYIVPSFKFAHLPLLFSIFQIYPHPFFLNKLMPCNFFLFNFAPLMLAYYLFIYLLLLLLLLLVGLEYNWFLHISL